MACPLDSLNSASFGTLSQLTLRICVGIAGSGLELALPYGFAWTDALSKMYELEMFELHLEYEGYFDISATSFGDQWGDIPELLADSNRMPKLKDVGISVTARVIEEEEGDEGWIKKDAEAFLEKVQAVVYPRWFLPLKIRQEQGDLDAFSYSTELSEVPANLGFN